MKGALTVVTLLLLCLTYTQALVIFVQEIDDTVAVTQIGGLTITSTVKELKQKIAVVKGLPVSGFQLLFNNALLNDMQPLAAYNVAEGDTITIISKESLLGFLLLGVPPVPPPLPLLPPSLVPPLLPPLSMPFPLAPPLPQQPLGLPLPPQPLGLPFPPQPLPAPLAPPMAPFLAPPLVPPILPPILPPQMLPPIFPLPLAIN
ncbi:hypothetical protein CBL_03418 [Carabus blaptoides fortunei]